MKELIVIQDNEPAKQLDQFISAINKGKVPVILPQQFDRSLLKHMKIPTDADFAVSSSGTTGKPKLYFRSFNSWKDFFPEQNKVFGISPDARIFINGSLAFTGNLNIAVCARSCNQFIFTSKELRPSSWANEIIENKIDTIYMIPDKLLYLAKTGNIFNKIKTIILGSQSVSKKQFALIRKAFPIANIILYYGATETSYISYKTLTLENTEEVDCVGKIFDSVTVAVNQKNHIFVKSPYCICGIEDFYDTKDLGTIKDDMLYLMGRADDVINIHGQKINKSEIIKCILSISGIEEAEITVEELNSIQSVIAHIGGKNLPEKIGMKAFSEIPPVFIPKKYIRYEKLPRNESGKICLK